MLALLVWHPLSHPNSNGMTNLTANPFVWTTLAIGTGFKSNIPDQLDGPLPHREGEGVGVYRYCPAAGVVALRLKASTSEITFNWLRT